MSTSIRKQLRSNPKNLLEKINDNIQSAEQRVAIKNRVDAVVEILAVETAKLEKRQQLSRKIGIAKKAREDSSQLIAEVSALSAEINTLKQQINDDIDAIEQDLTQSSIDTETPAVPRHLVRPAQNPTVNVAQDQAQDSANIETSHDTVSYTHLPSPRDS